LLILLSCDVESNPGPIYSLSGLYSNSSPTLNVVSDEYTVSIVVNNTSGDNAWTLSFNSSIGSNNINFRVTGTERVVFNDIYCGALSGLFVISIAQTFGSTAARFNILFAPLYRPAFSNVKVVNTTAERVPTTPQLSSPVNVTVANSNLPVTVSNVSPIEVEVSNIPLQVGVVHPTLLPVLIENEQPISVSIPTTDPIPITGTVSISNPLPSVANSFLNAFKK